MRYLINTFLERIGQNNKKQIQIRYFQSRTKKFLRVQGYSVLRFFFEVFINV